MSSNLMRLFAIALTCTSIASVQAAASCQAVRNDGEPAGELKDISGTQTYISQPGDKSSNSSTAILYVTDIFGVPLLQNKLLADSLASANYLVVMPDLFKGDSVPVTFAEAGLNLTAWFARHPAAEVDSIIAQTIDYMKKELGVTRIGAVGYCFGGKYVPRAMAQGKGVDVGFIAHPSNLEAGEIQAIDGPISIAAGELDASFNPAARRAAEDILINKNAIFQTTFYSGAPHGWAVRANYSIPEQKYAKEASFLQAVTWFDTWL